MKDDIPPYVDGPHVNDDAESFGGVIAAILVALAFYTITTAIIVICLTAMKGSQ